MTSSSPEPEERIIGGRYRLEELLGRGGMGEVWRARHLVLKSQVALKLLHATTAPDEATRKRFITEAQVTAQLKTKNAVQVFDFGVTDDGLPYLVMELIEGETLAHRIAREGRMEASEVAPILQKAGRALDRAHALGIVHRDFKPENIIVFADEEGNEEVKVLDFGIAKLIGELDAAPAEGKRPSLRPGAKSDPPPNADEKNPLTSFTRTGNMVGTPYYMAPEQVNDPAQVGRAADIWALGVVAYECLTGRRPFEDTSMPRLLKRVLERRYERASTIADVPPMFDDWFDTACAFAPKNRFLDASTAVTALAFALDAPAGATTAEMKAISRPAPSGRGAQRGSGPRVRIPGSELSETIDARAISNATSGEASKPRRTALVVGIGIAAALVTFLALMTTKRVTGVVPSAAPTTIAIATPPVTIGDAKTVAPAAIAPVEIAATARPSEEDHEKVDASTTTTASEVGARSPRVRAPSHPSATATAAATATVAATAPAAAAATAKPTASSPFQLPPLGL